MTGQMMLITLATSFLENAPELSTMQIAYRNKLVLDDPYHGKTLIEAHETMQKQYAKKLENDWKQKLSVVEFPSHDIRICVQKQEKEHVPLKHITTPKTESSVIIDTEQEWIGFQFFEKQVYQFQSDFKDVEMCYPIYDKHGWYSIVLILRCPPRILRSTTEKEDTFKWTQTCDFTDRLGHCRVLIAKLKNECLLEDIQEVFRRKKLKEHNFIPTLMQDVIINETAEAVTPIQDGRRSFQLEYMLQCLVTNNIFDAINMDRDFYQYLESIDEKQAIKAMEFLYATRKRHFDPVVALKKYVSRYGHVKDPKIPKSCVITKRVCITPTRIVYIAPEVYSYNRVLRGYKNKLGNFLRVSFTDENLGLLRRHRFSLDDLLQRIKGYLTDGVKIISRKFDFLGASSSQLKEHSLWMFWNDKKIYNKQKLDADSIQKWMGDFKKCVTAAKKLARMGQVCVEL
jgi:hypothetical protein